MGGKSTSRSGSGQKWARPFAKAGAEEVRSVYDANKGSLQDITKGITSLLPGASESYQGWSPITGQSQGYYSDVLSGKYLDPSNNTALQSILDRTARDVMGNVNSQFSQAGRYGSASHTDVLSRNLAEAQGSILADQYNRERGMMDQAAGVVPQQQAQQLASLLQASGVGAELPYTGTNALANQLAGLFSGGVQKQKQGLASTIGSLASSAAVAFSDRRLKTNIQKIGEYDDGLGRYEWSYVWGGPRHNGVMADEVAVLRPWALGPVVSGYATVNYEAL